MGEVDKRKCDVNAGFYSTLLVGLDIFGTCIEVACSKRGRKKASNVYTHNDHIF